MEFAESELVELLELIYERYHCDFRHYARGSLERRLRHALAKQRVESLSALGRLLEREPAAFSSLLQSLTVQVSDLFRDPTFFGALRQRVVPELCSYPSLKVWVAGCAAGEEVISLAILLKEEGLLERSVIYATDINPAALRRAESGIYAARRVDDFERNYVSAGGRSQLSRYYTRAYGSIVFERSLRSRVVYADHSLATDNVFSEVQLVLCRNVLIYFDRTLKSRALGLFADALCRRGFLGIGSRESLTGSHGPHPFHRIHPDEQLYQKGGAP